MDTQNFLLNRQAIVERIQARRSAVMEERAAVRHGFLGLSWMDWGQMLWGGGSSRLGLGWISSLLLPVAVPLLMAFGRQKMAPVLSKKSLLWKRLANFFSLACRL
ncbi:MAG: hypothetical protein WC859_07055 [Elusimicrobiota bacterium]|jgi:hypothetical protein